MLGGVGGRGGAGGGGAQRLESPAKRRLRPVHPNVEDLTSKVAST